MGTMSAWDDDDNLRTSELPAENPMLGEAKRHGAMFFGHSNKREVFSLLEKNVQSMWDSYAHELEVLDLLDRAMDVIDKSTPGQTSELLRVAATIAYFSTVGANYYSEPFPFDCSPLVKRLETLFSLFDEGDGGKHMAEKHTCPHMDEGESFHAPLSCDIRLYGCRGVNSRWGTTYV